MSRYLIEFRFFGRAKYDIKGLIREINKKFKIRNKRRPVPHITLVGPFTTKNEKRLVSDFKRLCDGQEIMDFSVVGFSTFEDTRVVYIDIEPAQGLDEFRWKLSKTLQQYCNLSPYDYNKKFEYHATLARNLNPIKFNKIKDYIKKKPKPRFKHVLMRVTLLRNSKILFEYDFLQRRLLNRKQALDQNILSISFEKLKDYLGIPIDEFDINKFQKGLINQIINKIWKQKIFFIADTHFDHANIIKYCNRPFPSKDAMNKTMLKNWNSKVRWCDIVFFLGDMSFGRGSRKTSYWLKKLNGNIIFLRGSHDKSKKIKFHKRLIFRYKGYKFLLSHEPYLAPDNWDGWVIHGHNHNNQMDRYPFINRKNKTINVSAEMLDYTPISIDELLDKL